MQIKFSRITVLDQDKALRFYTEVLGFAKKADMSMPGGSYRWLTVTSPDGVVGSELVLELAQLEATRTYMKAMFDAGVPMAGFITHDINAEYKKLLGRNVKFHGEPKNVGPIIAVLFEDTVGNLLNLAQPLVF